MELLLMLDAARGASAARITAVIPALRLRAVRQEGRAADLHRRAAGRRSARHRGRQPRADDDAALGAGARLLQRAGRSHERAQGAGANTSSDSRSRTRSSSSPDLGNAKAASHFARMLKLPVAAGSKQRLSDDKVVIDAIVGDVEGKNVIVIDDEIANGGTIIEVLQKLRERHVKRIAVACTHGLFTGKAIERLARAAGHRGDRHHRHRADPAGEAAAEHDGPVGGAASRRGHPAHPRRRVGERTVRRRRGRQPVKEEELEC